MVIPQLDSGPKSGLAVIQPTSVFNSKRVEGYVLLTQKSISDPVILTLKISGFTPNSIHGFHIHEFGDISSSDGMSSGGHFNPSNSTTHGCPSFISSAATSTSSGRSSSSTHAGDLGNITADSLGNVFVALSSSKLSLYPDHELGSVVGRGVIIHELADDCSSSSATGNAGKRLGQGVVGVRNATLDLIPRR